MRLPLQGIHVLDLSTVFSGPMAVTMLADQGASVIKIEPLEGDTCRMIGPAKGDLSATYIAANRGKRSLALDLKADAATPVLHALIKRCDVLVNNFRPGVMARLGLNDDTLKVLNPRLIHLSITGFGADGPYAGDKVYDSVIQAVAGVCASHREFGTGAPGLLSTTICDKLTALNAAQAITAALFARERDGKGCRIDIAMLDAALAFQWPEAMFNHAFLDAPPAAFPEFGATFRPWKTADGFLATMAPQQAEFRGLCQAVGHLEIASDPRFATLPLRSRNAAALRALLEPLMAQLPTDTVVQRCREFGVPTGKVNERHEVLTDPQVKHNAMLVEVDHGALGRVRLALAASRFDGERLPVPGPAAHLGEHGREILQEIGLEAAQIENLLRQGVMKVPEPLNL
jgi:crotonobetainyl-CoA:carnitine CoA-transferase CaiB-like acyl-CoA transferase